MAGEAKAAVKSAVELEDGRVLLGTPAYNTEPADGSRRAASTC